jgi:hypothetical protein
MYSTLAVTIALSYSDKSQPISTHATPKTMKAIPNMVSHTSTGYPDIASYGADYF